MKKKFIIIYSECFRSTIIYSDFIRKNHKDIKALVKIPNFPKKSGKINFLFLKKLIFSSNKYLLYQILQTFIYQLFAIIYKNSLRNLSNKYNISFFKNNKLPNQSFLKKNIINFNKKDVILCSTAHIFSENDLKIKNVILNFHEAPLPKFRGSALYYHLVNENVKLFRTSIIQPISLVDAGKVELVSKNIKINKFNVFKVLLLGYVTQSELILEIINKKLIKIKKNFKPKNEFKPYKIPSKEIEKKLDKQNKNIAYSDLIFFFNLLNSNFNNVNGKLKKFIFSD